LSELIDNNYDSLRKTANKFSDILKPNANNNKFFIIYCKEDNIENVANNKINIIIDFMMFIHNYTSEKIHLNKNQNIPEIFTTIKNEQNSENSDVKTDTSFNAYELIDYIFNEYDLEKDMKKLIDNTYKELREEDVKKSNTSTLYISPTKVYYPDNIFFMISMSIDSKPFVNEKIYRVVGYIRTKINGTEETLNTKNISMDLCSNVFDETYKYYDSIKDLNLSNFYCISLDKNIDNGINKEDLFINEFWGNDGFQMLQIKVYNCIAIAENKDECASKEIIKKKLESPIISYYTLKN